MKTQLIRIMELTCELVKSFWNLLAATMHRIWNALKWRNLSVIGKILLTAFVFVCSYAATLLAMEYYQTQYGRVEPWYQDDEKSLSEDVETHLFNTGTSYEFATRVYNKKTGKYTTPRLDWVADVPERDTLTVFSHKDKRGFLNINDGRIVIKEQYDKAWVFSEGLAAVVLNGKIGFINARNEIVIPFQYDCGSIKTDYLFRDGFCTMTDGKGSFGLIDTQGDWIIEPQYDCIQVPRGEGYRIVRKGDKYGLLDPQLEFAVPVEYDGIEFTENYDGIQISQNGRKWQTDFKGNVTIPFIVDYTDYIYYKTGDEESELSGFIQYRVDDGYGVMRRDNGQVVIPAIYSSVNMLSETLFEVQLSDYGSWVIYDSEGNLVKN